MQGICLSLPHHPQQVFLVVVEILQLGVMQRFTNSAGEEDVSRCDQVIFPHHREA